MGLISWINVDFYPWMIYINEFLYFCSTFRIAMVIFENAIGGIGVIGEQIILLNTNKNYTKGSVPFV